MSVTEQDFLKAAEYAYENFLSKPYTNQAVKFDWEYKAQDGTVINRPNHGLAHSFRGASYAPVVCAYFKQFAKDKDQYQFSEDDIKKIQIALMFRVAGRENDGGFSDNPQDYMRYQKQHGAAFRKYCQDNPGVFSPAEVEKYAEALETYAKPGEKDPLKVIFKSCHNIDLIRCCDNNRMERELEPIREQIGDHTNDLVVYADQCIRQTGTRIADTSPVTRKEKAGYEESKFVAVSQSAKECAKEIKSVPSPAQMYYEKAMSLKWKLSKQDEYISNLQMASALGYDKATKALKGSLQVKIKGLGKQTEAKAPQNAIDLSHLLGSQKLTLATPGPTLAEIRLIEDKWDKSDEASLFSTAYLEKIKAYGKLLNNEMKLPQPLTIKVDGKVYKGEDALLLISKDLEKIASTLNATMDMYISKNQKLDQKDAFDDLSYIARAIAEQVPSANSKVNNHLTKIHDILDANEIKKKDEKDVSAEVAKRLFLEGKGSEFQTKVKEIATKAGNDEQVQLESGPLNKNLSTYKYEELMRNMLSGKEFEAKSENGQVIITFGKDNDKTEYNLTEILKYANLNHVSLSDADTKAYLELISSDNVKFGPHRPNVENPQVPLAVKGQENIKNLDAEFIAKDPSLNNLNQAERMAINIYSTGFYKNANAMLRGGNVNVQDKAQLKELICTTAVAISGLNKIDSEIPVNTFRGEKNLPQAVLKSRIEAAEKGGVTIETGFISSSDQKPDAAFAFKDNVNDVNIGIEFHDLKGKNIKPLSAFPNEREFLIPPTQVQWQHHATVKGGHLFSARPATTPTGLEPNALTGLSADNKAQIGLSSQNVSPLPTVNPLPAANPSPAVNPSPTVNASPTVSPAQVNNPPVLLNGYNKAKREAKGAEGQENKKENHKTSTREATKIQKPEKVSSSQTEKPVLLNGFNHAKQQAKDTAEVKQKAPIQEGTQSERQKPKKL